MQCSYIFVLTTVQGETFPVALTGIFVPYKYPTLFKGKTCTIVCQRYHTYKDVV